MCAVAGGCIWSPARSLDPTATDAHNHNANTKPDYNSTQFPLILNVLKQILTKVLMPTIHSLSIATFKDLKFPFSTVNCCFGLFGASFTTISAYNMSRAEAAALVLSRLRTIPARAEDRLRGTSKENYEWELLLPAWARVLVTCSSLLHCTVLHCTVLLLPAWARVRVGPYCTSVDCR